MAILRPRRFRGGLPDELWRWALEEHPILHGLSSEEEGVLRDLTVRLLSKKQVVVLDDFELTDEMRLSIAVQASLPVLRLGLGWYRDWGTLYLVSEEYEYQDTETDEAGVVHEISDTVSGQAMPLGSIVLSAADVEASGWCDGYNVVIHEMAHVLDRQNGSLDGAPPLHGGMSAREWTEAFTEAYTDFQGRIVGDSSRAKGTRRRGSRGRSSIDPYAAEAPEEFFAVLSEVFFEQPWVVREEYPGVSRQLELFYRQDPAARLSAGPA